MFLPSNEHTFHFKATGEKTKQKYEGTFTVKCLLTAVEAVEVGLRTDAFNRGSKTIHSSVAILNRAFAELDIRILKAPSFWKDANDGRDLLDPNIVLEVFDQALGAEKVYTDRVEAAAKEADEQAEKAIETKKKKNAEKSSD
jgi:hypothetical protein